MAEITDNFSDDKKVVRLQSEKKWSEKGYTEI